MIKKLSIILITSVLFFTLTGCGYKGAPVYVDDKKEISK